MGKVRKIVRQTKNKVPVNKEENVKKSFVDPRQFKREKTFAEQRNSTRKKIDLQYGLAE
jgi:hypothetical protein